MADLVRLSKFLAVLLRHEPAKFGLTLDEEGFADTDAVWEQVNRRYPARYTYQDLLKAVEGDQQGKKRYEIRGRRIRALFGHSTPEKIAYPPAIPPEFLYHGTTSEALASIRAEGLRSLSRQYVHLAVNVGRAEQVARRHAGKPVMLVIRALEAYRAGIAFYNPEPEHYLAEAIPPEYIEFPER
jgi:putative RNA 2'-phosphotransferase